MFSADASTEYKVGGSCRTDIIVATDQVQGLICRISAIVDKPEELRIYLDNPEFQIGQSPVCAKGTAIVIVSKTGTPGPLFKGVALNGSLIEFACRRRPFSVN